MSQYPQYGYPQQQQQSGYAQAQYAQNPGYYQPQPQYQSQPQFTPPPSAPPSYASSSSPYAADAYSSYAGQPYRQPSPNPSADRNYEQRPPLQPDFQQYQQDSGYNLHPGGSYGYTPPSGAPPGRMDGYGSFGPSRGPSPRPTYSNTPATLQGYAPSPSQSGPAQSTPSLQDKKGSSPDGAPSATGQPAGSDAPKPGMMGKVQGVVKKIAPGEDIEALLIPPPPGFLRTPPSNLPYGPFEPTALVGQKKDKLDSGFPNLIPPSRERPHPFATHDVREEDWMRFVGDMKKAASLALKDKVVSNMLPMAFGLGVVGELRILAAYQTNH